jgi:manganese-dependent ADP-ribose/CDP-alcohol diphosphatase
MACITLGVVADIQYRSDKDDYMLASVGQMRSYRAALKKTSEAVTALTTASQPVQAIIHLGDIVDGREASHDRQVAIPQVLLELDDVLAALSKRPSGIPLYHVVGNHCLYVGRGELTRRLGLTESAYYACALSPHWRLVVLDSMDVGLDRAQGDPRRDMAEAYLKEKQGEPNAVSWNGGPSPTQLRWLQTTLESSAADGENVIVCGHHPLIAQAARAEHVAWFSQAVLDIFESNRSVVRAYFAGHFHSGGYALSNGIHHITFPAILDSDETNSYATVQLYLDHIFVRGFGVRATPTRSYPF